MSSREILRKSVKHGIGRLTASSDATSRQTGAVTRLTQVAHKAPTRLIPVKKTSVQSAGAAACALSNYGAGMLQGDSAELSVHVEEGAKLGLMTQGAARIYTQRVPGEVKASMDVKVEKDGILVFTPDPCAMFASSSYSQTQQFEIHPDSSVALIDWFSSGRFKNHERWEFDKLTTRTSLKWMEITDPTDRKSITEGNDIPFLQDSICIDLQGSDSEDKANPNNRDAHGVADFNCFASLILYGNEMERVKEKCQSLSDSFAAQHTRIRQREQEDVNERQSIQLQDVSLLNLADRVVMGVSKVPLPGKPSDAYVVRLAGKTNEDIYRIFHNCLLPLAPSFGFEFYKERILARRSEIPSKELFRPLPAKNAKRTSGGTKPSASYPPLESESLSQTSSSFWSIVMLADSGLPTGSFAHSAGLEAGAQLGLVKNEEDVLNFIQAATRSSVQLLAPFLISGLRIAKLSSSSSDQPSIQSTTDLWEKLHQQCHAVMVTNEPACSASIDQGKSLLRVATHWLTGSEKSRENIDANNVVLSSLKSGPNPHIAPTLGVIGGLLGLDEVQICRLLAYCMARDLVSSAVRLSLVGPLASVPMLDSAHQCAEEGMLSVMEEMKQFPEDPLRVAATSAPVIEAVHPCHEILQVRLFRS